MFTLRQLVEALEARTLPRTEDSALDSAITHVASADAADSASLVFAESAAALSEALACPAAAVLVTDALAETAPSSAKPMIIVKQSRLAFARAARLLRTPDKINGIHATAILGKDAVMGEDVSVEAYAVLGDHVTLGRGTRIGAGCAIGQGVRIGADCNIYPRVVIYGGVTLGDRVVIHAGCVLGSDGFGYARDEQTGAYLQFPQQGTLRIEDDVEIGANSTIDRGALAETRIEHGAKLDNLVHIGHNVRVGRNVVIAAQTGISGSSAVGDGAILGGQVGIGEHADVGPGVILGGGAGVLSKKKLKGPGMVFWGRPAQPLREYLKGLATLARLTRKAKD